MQKKINLEEIILKHCYVTQDDVTDVHSSIESVKSAMKESITLALELAAENVTVDVEDWLDCGEEYPFEINTQSILDVINLIE